MTEVLLHPGYFGPIDQFAVMAKADAIVFENEDNYQKQTYRNRQYIYGANGKLLLNIPIKHLSTAKQGNNAGKHQKYKDVKVENNFHWQRDHWRSIQTAYRTSPFFEYYEDDFAPIYERPVQFLLDFNYRCTELVFSCVSLAIHYTKTTEFIAASQTMIDQRGLIVSKRKNIGNEIPYLQVFEEKYGFLPNLSILDLLFNEGPQTLHYLKNQV